MKASLDEVFLTEQEIENKYSGNEAKIAIKKFDRIQHLIESGYEKLDNFKHEDISVFIGNTRCGKSTVVNVAIGNKLITRKEKLKISLVIDDSQDNMPGPVIGNKSVSETTIPGRYEAFKEGFGVIWDCPGFADNRGVTQDIANSFYIKKLFENARSVKIYLVTDFADIRSDSIKGFIDMTQSLELMFGENIIELIDKNSIAMIITKANVARFAMEDIKEHYREYFLDAQGMNKGEYAEELVHYFLDNDDTIAILPEIDNSNDDINEQLLHPIKQLKIDYINVKHYLTVQPGLSPEAAKFIYTYYNDDVVLSEFKHFFQQTLGLQKITKAKLDQERDKQCLKNNLADCRQKSDIINKLRAELNDTTSLEDVSKIIIDLLPDCLQIENSSEYIQEYFQNRSMMSKAVFLDFLTSSVLKMTNTLQPMVEHFLGTLSIGYAEDIANIRQRLGEITEEENIQKQQELVKELQESRDRHETSIKENKQKLADQAARYVKAMKENEKKYIQDREQMQKDMLEQQALRDEQHKKEMHDIQTSYQKELNEIVKSNATAIAERDKKLHDVIEKHKEGMKEMQTKLNDKMAEYNQKLHDTVEVHEEDMKKMQISYQTQLDEVVQKSVQESAEYNQRLRDVIEEHKEDMRQMQIKTEYDQNYYESLINTQAVEHANAMHEQQMSSVQNYLEEIQQQNAHLSEVNQKMSKLDWQRKRYGPKIAKFKDDKKKLAQYVEKVAAREGMSKTSVKNEIKKAGCVIFNVTKEQYDNPLLNEHELLSKIYEKFGSKKCDDFISLTSILDAQQVQDIIDSQEPLDIIGAMLNC